MELKMSAHKSSITIDIYLEHKTFVKQNIEIDRNVCNYRILGITGEWLIAIFQLNTVEVEVSGINLKTKKIEKIFNESYRDIDDWRCLKITNNQIFLTYGCCILTITDMKLTERRYLSVDQRFNILAFNDKWIIYVNRNGIHCKNRETKSHHKIKDGYPSQIFLTENILYLKSYRGYVSYDCYYSFDLKTMTLEEIKIEFYSKLFLVDGVIYNNNPPAKIYNNLDLGFISMVFSYHHYITKSVFTDIILLRILMASRRDSLTFFNHRDFFSLYLLANNYGQEVSQKIITAVEKKLFFKEKTDLGFFLFL